MKEGRKGDHWEETIKGGGEEEEEVRRRKRERREWEKIEEKDGDGNTRRKDNKK